MRQADQKIASGYMEKMDVDERVAELEARKQVVDGYLKRPTSGCCHYKCTINNWSWVAKMTILQENEAAAVALLVMHGMDNRNPFLWDLYQNAVEVLLF